MLGVVGILLLTSCHVLGRILELYHRVACLLNKNAYVAESGNEGGEPLPLAFQNLILMI